MRHVPSELLFPVSDMLKCVLNLVSLESDLSVSEAYISQSLGS